MDEQIVKDKRAFEVYLAERMESIEAPDTLKQAMSYSLLADGKKMRPLFAIATARTLGLEIETVFPLAMAIEMIHTYSLIHDDLPAMDDDDLRRGRPTNHIVYGEAMAILAGDALLTQSFEVLLDTPAEAEIKLELVRMLSIAAGSNGMIAGQVLDVEGEGKALLETDLTIMHQKKTGCLLVAPIVGAATIAGVSTDNYQLLKRFGECIGLAFQIQDDILDVRSTSEVLGKSASDAENDKSTYVSILGMEASQQRFNDLITEAMEILEGLAYPATYLRLLVDSMVSRQK
ncbi:polyprenyl synthetase family protein [Culicoidibacter larvae]|uniref:Farnesyl diphosphate synthase n=1 Tax=Culicoidibacter larvae TaxID=2579976 RepID=A0A5R8QEJ8_9FIRM|nr:farnesyl diphosphate synthase [Culicoidibacter larvae]TLG74217.1 polyprenyl synthetase family protein [Culicoidibacter larvae]